MMFYTLTTFFLLFFSLNFSLEALKIIQEEGKKPGLLLQINEKKQQNTRVFDFSSQGTLMGSVRKPPLFIGSNYEVYDDSNQFEGEGIVKIYSLGTPFARGIEIEIFDEQGTNIGLIEGQVVSGSPANLRIFDAKGELLGNAYLNPKEDIFGIDNQEQHYILRMKKNLVPDVIDNWDIVVFYPDAIDIRILKIFATFVVDVHSEFAESN